LRMEPGPIYQADSARPRFHRCTLGSADRVGVCCRYSDCQALKTQRVFISVVGDGLVALKVTVLSMADCLAPQQPPLSAAGGCAKPGLTAAEKEKEGCPPEKWTIMVYMSAEYVEPSDRSACQSGAADDLAFGCSNDLEYFGVSDGFEMASARYTTVKLVVMMDRGDTDEYARGTRIVPSAGWRRLHLLYVMQQTIHRQDGQLPRLQRRQRVRRAAEQARRHEEHPAGRRAEHVRRADAFRLHLPNTPLIPGGPLWPHPVGPRCDAFLRCHVVSLDRGVRS